jgi:type IV pilus assembly protein PilY1
MFNTRLDKLIQSAALTLAIGLCAVPQAVGADVDLATTPMVSGVSKSVPPNVYFILDDSTSMSWDYMPDEVGDNHSGDPCFKNFGYNKIYYNPGINYTPPLNADGTSKAAQTFTAAKVDGFGVTSSASTNLSTVTTVAFNLTSNPFSVATSSNTVTVAHTGHGYSVGDLVAFSSTSAVKGIDLDQAGPYDIKSVSTNSYTILWPNAAATSGGSSSGGGSNARELRPDYGWYQYTSDPTDPPTTCASNASYKLKVPTTSAEKQNYANWYSYYRTRINMMKSASGRAFTTIGDKYRVGFDKISNNSATAVTVNIGKFDATKKAAWYTALYAADPSPGGNTNYTPLRGALSKAGRLYAGRIVTGNNDPVQYSCQQNFAILTTDGYWNLTDEVSSGTAKYGPYKMDNSTLVGQQDWVSASPKDPPTPYFDGGKYVNTLADIAMYYYQEDLRGTKQLNSTTPETCTGTWCTGGLLDDGTTRLPVWKNNVPLVQPETASWQHMTLFGLGLGVAGTLTYDENYLNNGSASYNAIKQGTTNWPNPDVTNTSPQVTARIDDLWHAAVNGRGRYLSASNPDAVITALNNTLSAIAVKTGSAAAAATSSLEPVSGDNFAFVARYTTGNWYGDLLAYTIDPATGTLSATTTWSAQTELSKTAKVDTASDSRTIYTFSSGASKKRKSFDAPSVSNNLQTEIAANYFKSSGTNPKGKLSQYDTLTSAQQAAATDEAMIRFIRGQTGNQGQPADTSTLFRNRFNPLTTGYVALGDIVNTTPVFVKKPPFSYSDTGYLAFATDTTNVDRTPVVYASANDGMLHAFNADTGNELWAYIPSAVIPWLYKLADAGYANNHRFYVDGPITVGDAYDTTTSTWKTVLIGGLGGGGKAYFAIDVTDPADPKVLWEFGATDCTACSTTDADMGYAYGNAALTKRSSDGKWVVVFTSGYNNNTGGGDGKGRLYVLDAFSGAKLSEYITDNSVNDPNLSGIGKINNFVINGLLDNTTQYVYGGDLSGALWRFDLNASSGTYAQRLGRTSATAGNQPITVRPELARIKDGAGNYYRVVYFGTGRYLGLTDLNSTAPSSNVAQALYAVKDTGADVGVLPTGGTLVSQTLNSSVSPRRIDNPASPPVDWANKNGWYVTLPVGERVNVDPRLQLGTLVAISNDPNDDYCTIGGVSWLYAFDYASGAPVATANNKAVGFSIGNSLSTGLTLIRTTTHKLVAIVTEADTTVQSMSVPVAAGTTGAVRRLGYREIY